MVITTCPSWYTNMLCDCQLAAVMEAATGRIDRARVRAPVLQNGLVESIRFVLGGQCSTSRRVLRLLTRAGIVRELPYRIGEVPPYSSFN